MSDKHKKKQGKNDKQSQKKTKSDTNQKNDKNKAIKTQNPPFREPKAVPINALISKEIVEVEKPVNKYSKRKIVNNWKDIELPDDVHCMENTEEKQQNLEEIFRKPISSGGHFQFKHEKSWNFTAKELEANDLFTLNMKKITEHLLCVPFHVRNNIDESLFNEDQIAAMNKSAENNRSKYLNIDSALKIDSLLSSIKPTKNVPNNSISSKTPTKSNEKTQIDDDLDKILNLTSSIDVNLKISPSTAIKVEKDNLEDWLDEYL